jgi:hypothetical protein
MIDGFATAEGTANFAINSVADPKNFPTSVTAEIIFFTFVLMN